MVLCAFCLETAQHELVVDVQIPDRFLGVVPLLPVCEKHFKEYNKMDLVLKGKKKEYWGSPY